MNDPFALEIRARAAALIPPRAFLRRDRKDALFITNAPRIDPDRDWISPFKEAGFIPRMEGGLLRLWPDAGWFERLEEAFPEPPDFLCRTLLRFRGMPPEDDAIALFALGARILSGDPNTGYEDRLRRSAAVALRKGTGGGLYACGLIHYKIQKELNV